MIRPANKGDLPAIADLVMKWSHAPEHPSLERLDPERMMLVADRLIMGQYGTLLVSEADGEVVGVIALTVSSHLFTADMSATVLVWYVDRDKRHGGDGFALLRAAEDWAKDHGAVRFYASDPTGNGLSRLYGRLGYHEVERSFMRELR